MPLPSVGKFISKIPGPLGQAAKDYYASKTTAEPEVGVSDQDRAKRNDYEIITSVFLSRGYSRQGAEEIAHWVVYCDTGLGPSLGKVTQNDALLWTNYITTPPCSKMTLEAVHAKLKRRHVQFADQNDIFLIPLRGDKAPIARTKKVHFLERQKE